MVVFYVTPFQGSFHYLYSIPRALPWAGRCRPFGAAIRHEALSIPGATHPDRGAHVYDFDNAGAGKAADHPVQRLNWYDVVKWCPHREGGAIGGLYGRRGRVQDRAE